MEFARKMLWLLGICAALAVALRLTILDAWTIPDDPVLAASLSPTLVKDDVVLLLTKGTPGFGDLVRCTNPRDSSQYVVGRIAGVAGDVVQIDGGRLSVNGKLYEGSMSCPESVVQVDDPTSGSPVDLRCDVVEMAGSWHYRGTTNNTFIRSQTRAEVGRDMVYLVSDDRAFPYDSRNYGSVPAASCTERIVFRVYGSEGWRDEASRLTFIH